jgi:hypothetical protein
MLLWPDSRPSFNLKLRHLPVLFHFKIPYNHLRISEFQSKRNGLDDKEKSVYWHRNSSFIKNSISIARNTAVSRVNYLCLFCSIDRQKDFLVLDYKFWVLISRGGVNDPGFWTSGFHVPVLKKNRAIEVLLEFVCVGHWDSEPGQSFSCLHKVFYFRFLKLLGLKIILCWVWG